MEKISWNKGIDNRKIYFCIKCGKEIKDYRIRKYCSHLCHSLNNPITQKGRKQNPESIKKMVATRKIKGNYGWTEIQKTYLSEKMKGRIFTEKHRKNMSLAGKGKKFSDEHRKHLSEVKKGKISNSLIHQENIQKQILNFQKNGYSCIRIDSCPLPDFIAIKDNKFYAVEIEGGSIRPNKYICEHNYADIIWIQFRRTN